MKKIILILVLLISTLSKAQNQEVKTTIENFFVAFHAKDTVRLKSICSEKMILQSVQDSGLTAQLSNESITDFFKSLASIPENLTFKEKMLAFRFFSISFTKKFLPVSIGFCIYIMMNVTNTIFVSHSNDNKLIYGVGLGFGVIKPIAGGSGESEYAYVPYSLSVYDNTLLTDINLGWSHDQTTHPDKLTWGVGESYSINTYVTVFAEAFGDTTTNPTLHSGVSFAIIPNRIQLDLTCGKNTALKKDSNFFTVGLNFYLPKLTKH